MGYMNEFPHSRMFDSDLREIIRLYNEALKKIPEIADSLKLFNMDFKFPELYGAIGDGVNDDTEAFTKLLEKSGVIILQPNKTYRITKGLSINSNTYILGNSATIKIDGVTIIDEYDSGLGIFTILESNNIYISNVIFDMNSKKLPAKQEIAPYENVALYLKKSENIVVDNCTFLNLYSFGIYCRECSGYVNIKNCDFKAPSQNSGYTFHVYCLTLPENLKLSFYNNIFNGNDDNVEVGTGALFIANSRAYTDINDNTFIYCGRDNTFNHRAYPIDLYGDAHNVKIIGNHIKTKFNAIRLNGSKNVIVTNNTIDDYALSGASGGEPMILIANSEDTYECGNIVISQNTIKTIGNSTDFLIVNNYTDKVIDSIVINDNIITGLFNGTTIKLMPGVNNINIIGNTLGNSTTLLTTVNEFNLDNSSIDNVVFSNNIGIGRIEGVSLPSGNYAVNNVRLENNNITALKCFNLENSAIVIGNVCTPISDGGYVVYAANSESVTYIFNNIFTKDFTQYFVGAGKMVKSNNYLRDNQIS